MSISPEGNALPVHTKSTVLLRSATGDYFRGGRSAADNLHCIRRGLTHTVRCCGRRIANMCSTSLVVDGKRHVVDSRCRSVREVMSAIAPPFRTCKRKSNAPPWQRCHPLTRGVPVLRRRWAKQSHSDSGVWKVAQNALVADSVLFIATIFASSFHPETLRQVQRRSSLI